MIWKRINGLLLMELMFFYGTMGMGGAERVIASLANQFAANPDDRIYIVTLCGGKSSYTLDERVTHINLSDAPAGTRSLRVRMEKAIRLRKTMCEIDPDVVVAFSVKQCVNAQVFCWPRRFSLIGSERANLQYYPMPALERFLAKRLLHGCDGYIFQTESARSNYPYNVGRSTTVIPNGLFSDTLMFAPIAFEKRNLKKICAIGRLNPQKDYPTMIRAFCTFSRTHPGYTLHIYGAGAELDILKQLAATLGIAGQVIFAGLATNVIDRIKDAGMFLSTSVFEGMSNSLMEALACGIPCVATDCPYGTNELIENSRNGFLVPVGDVEAVAQAMAALADNPLLAEAFSMQALKIRETHSREAITQQYYDYIESVVYGKHTANR